MDIIELTTPTNILTEKQTFFADPTYNPQLVYPAAVPLNELSVWGFPKKSFYDHAVKMMAKYPLPQDNPTTLPKYVTEAEVEAGIADFNQQYELETPVKIIFSPNVVSRCKVLGLSIYFQLPLRYTQSRFVDLCRHELETHILRRLNHRAQGWSTEICAEPDLRRTEEGLAGLNTYLTREDRIFRKSYLTYIAVTIAQKGSFADVFKTMRGYGMSQATAWNIALRTKRGLADTSQPGGLTKDITYLEGQIQVWNWLQNSDHDPKDLYIGRIALDQVSEYKSLRSTPKLKFPVFLDKPDEYRAIMKDIGEINQLSSIDLDSQE